MVEKVGMPQMARFGNEFYKFRKEVASVKKLKEILDNLKPDEKITKAELIKKSGATGKTIDRVLKEEYPNIKLAKGQKINIGKINVAKQQKADADFKKLMDSGYLDDYKKKIELPKGTSDKSLTNTALAKKYFPNISKVAAIGRIERANKKIRKDNPDLNYKEIDQQEFVKKRLKRLDTTVGPKAKYLKGTDAFPFHHIMPIGGETQLTTNDVAVISKQMNSKLAPYNKKLNDIADAITTNFNNQPEGYLNKIEQLNNNAEQIVAKATKELPKKFQPYIGFTRLDPITDEYGTPINIQETRVGAVREKGIPLRDLSNEQLTKLKKSIRSLSEKEKIGYCSLLSRGGLPGDCAAAIDNDPVKAAKIFEEAPATSSAMVKVKNAALGFLRNPGIRGFGAAAIAGAAGAGLVKEFRNDDPTTYLSNEDQQKSMLVDMATQPVSLDIDRPAILDYQLPALGAEAAAGLAVTAPSTIKASKSRALGIEKKRVAPGTIKTGARVLGRGLASLGTPLALLPMEAMNVTSQIAEGDSPLDIATDPLNYLGATFAEPATRIASRGVNPKIAAAMRLGMSPGALRLLSRAGGIGLGASLGIMGLQKLSDL